jgi:outer membrane protein OmpA-like peptidoglycan-associated protein
MPRPVAAMSIAPPPPEPAVAALPPPASPPPTLASLSPRTAPVPVALRGTSAGFSIAFGPGSTKLGDDGKKRLDGVIRSMTSNGQLRAEIAAYAAGTTDTASQARRMSLSRALAVRSYLIGNGIASTRLDVRALGNQVETGSPDRVDISLAGR